MPNLRKYRGISIVVLFVVGILVVLIVMWIIAAQVLSPGTAS